jgi:type VI secretion system secreted protein VgrG
VKALIERSPTLKADINKLKAEGWEFEFTTGQSEVREDKKIIAIQNDGNEYGTVQRIAHEVGHVVSPIFREYDTKEHYVDSRLADEGAAVMYNIKIQQEILQSDGGKYENIGVNCGIPPCHAQYGQPGRYDHVYAQYLEDGDFQAACQRIGDLRKDELTGDNKETYQQYYKRDWDTWEQEQKSKNPGTP